MASMAQVSEISAVLLPRGGYSRRAGDGSGQVLMGASANGILSSKRSLMLPIRRRVHGRVHHSTCIPSGVPGRSWRTCMAATDPGQGEDLPTQQPETSSTSAYLPNSPSKWVEDSNFFNPPPPSKGWDNYQLLAELRSLAVIADDRSEMHGAVAVQRDNWGKLLQVTITMSMISAGILSALNTRETQSFSLSFTAVLLAAGSLIFMSLENWFQPSQLAEEQRAATRLFKNMVQEIEQSLKPGSGFYLKEDAQLYYEAKLEKLKYLDKAFPLPLFPGGIEKFPKNVGPAVFSAEVDLTQDEVSPLPDAAHNGWTEDIVNDLKRTSDLLKKKDIANYVRWEKNVLKINKALAITGPVLALSSIVANLVPGTGVWGAVVASGCCVSAALCSSFSHDAQVGMVYEMYRDVAGSFEDINNEIQRNLRLPVEKRQDGKLFHQKVALTLGRKEGMNIVTNNAQKTASKLM